MITLQVLTTFFLLMEQLSSDFIKKSSIISYSRNALEAIHTDIEKFATAEHLTAHANSIKVRFEN